MYVRIIIVFYIESRKGKVINMGMTMTQKILAAHAGLDSVIAGQLIEADLVDSPVGEHAA